MSRSGLALVVFIASALAVLSAFVLASPAAPSVLLRNPGDNESVFEGRVFFEWIASGKAPLNCTLFLGNQSINAMPSANNIPSSTSVELAPSEFEWRISCIDDDGVRGESVSRKLVVKSVGELIPKPFYSGVVQGFLVSGATVARAVGESGSGFLESWSARAGERISFSTKFLNDGANAFTAYLLVRVKDVSDKEVALLKTRETQVNAGTTALFEANWTPEKSGDYYAEGEVIGVVGEGGVEGGGEGVSENSFGRYFMKLVVREPPQIDWLLFLAVVCLTAIALASVKAWKNASEIKEGLD